ncbi:MAG: PilZ domain-containing protein [Planctomycetes bacterium]|nr:PilZ domain-containing protein [Planctomycetota bacterium]
MSTRRLDPSHVRLEVDGHDHPAVALEIRGHGAAIRSPHAVHPAEDVRLHLDWPGGDTTCLAGVVRAVAPMGAEHLAHVEVTGIDGDWASFLAHVGPALEPV